MGLNSIEAVETEQLEYGRGNGNSQCSVKCVDIGKNIGGDSALLGRN